jgi:hypothetical protein
LIRGLCWRDRPSSLLFPSYIFCSSWGPLSYRMHTQASMFLESYLKELELSKHFRFGFREKPCKNVCYNFIRM